MEARSIYKVAVVLLSIVLLSQVAFSECSSDSIIPFVGDRDLTLVEQSPIRRGDVEICVYKIRYSREINSYYMYTLLSNDEVVYCGITNDPKRRAKEHSDGRRNEYKVFDQMVAVGFFSKSAALDQEKECVCEYDPTYNKAPFCPYEIIGGE